MKATDFVTAFIDHPRARLADPLVRHSDAARTLAAQLDLLESEYQEHLDEKLTAREAALESGYSEDNIRLLRRRGVISERRRDLPRKPGHGVDRPKPVVVATEPPSIAERVVGMRRA